VENAERSVLINKARLVKNKYESIFIFHNKNITTLYRIMENSPVYNEGLRRSSILNSKWVKKQFSDDPNAFSKVVSNSIINSMTPKETMESKMKSLIKKNLGNPMVGGFINDDYVDSVSGSMTTMFSGETMTKKNRGGRKQTRKLNRRKYRTRKH